MASEKQEIVIVGAGIIGVCTAYYLTKHKSFDPSKHHITIIEASEPAAGSSGKAGGLLALWAFPEQLVPLSFKLHQELADEHNGYENWGYRRVSTLQISGGDKVTKPCKDLPKDLDWVKRELIKDYEPLGNTDVTGQVHPYYFTTYLLKKCQESECVDLVIGKVTEISSDKGMVESVKYTKKGETKQLDANQVIVTAGPWTSKVVSELPISSMRAHSITIDPGREISPYALFTDLSFKSNSGRVAPEIYARKDEVYVCGEGDQKVPLPEYASDVLMEQSKCDDIHKYACQISNDLANGTRKKSQACYLPVAPHSSPLLGECKINNLYVAAGHSCWGINNAPGTGKVMSEIVFDGKPVSVDLDEDFDPKLC